MPLEKPFVFKENKEDLRNTYCIHRYQKIYLVLTLPPFPETFHNFIRFLRGTKCHRLIKYQTRKIEFKGLNVAAGSAVEISLGEFDHEIKNVIDSIPQTAQALDDYQFNIWRYIEQDSEQKGGGDLTPEERKMYKIAVFEANNHMLTLRSTLEAAKQDPVGQRDKLRATIDDIRNFVNSLTLPKQTIHQRHNVISNALIGFTTKVRTKLWSVENREAQVLDQTKRLHARLMQVIRNRSLSSQLLKGSDSSISEIEEVLISNRIVQTEESSRKFANKITETSEKAANGEQITLDEFGDYTLAIAWFEMELDDLQQVS
jgi:hypothetical protein